MNDTMRSVLIQGAKKLLEGEIHTQEFEQGLIMAIAEAPYNQTKVDDLVWLAKHILIMDEQELIDGLDNLMKE